jgi:hypothetical protein
MVRAIATVSLAAGIAFLVDSAIARAGVRLTQVPDGFPPFTALPILSGCVGGMVMASLAYAILKVVSRQPGRTFLFVAMGALVLSFGLPLRLSFTKSRRFAGVTPSAQMLLVLMHSVVATAAVVTLLEVDSWSS